VAAREARMRSLKAPLPRRLSETVGAVRVFDADSLSLE
jgi:hypothetical protein